MKQETVITMKDIEFLVKKFKCVILERGCLVIQTPSSELTEKDFDNIIVKQIHTNIKNSTIRIVF